MRLSLVAFCFCYSLNGLGETLVESLYAALSVNEALLSGIERVALAADFNPYEGFCRACIKCVAAGTDYLRKCILWVNSFFHGCFLDFMRKR